METPTAGSGSTLQFGITIPSEYEYALYVENGLMKVSKKGKWGLINLSGEVILEPVFDDIEEFDGSYAKVMIRKDDGRLYGMIDTAGEVILPIEYEHITKWENGYYVVSANNSHSLLTPSLNVIIPHRDNYLRRLNDTYIIEGPALYGIRLLDYSGAEIIYDWPFVDVEIFENGMLKVIHTRSEYPGSSTIGIYANNGKLIYKKDYCDDITYIGNGLFLLKEYCYNYSLPGKYVYNVINLQGEEIFHINYDEIEVTKNWNFLIKKKGYYGKAKVSGEIFIQPKYSNKIIFTQDTSEVKINDFDPAHKINMDGQLIVTDENQTEIVLDKDYYWGSDYIYGISIVRSLQTEALGVIDRDGNIILPPKYKHIDILSNQTIRVIGKSSLCTIFDLSGKCIRKYKPRTYDEIEDYILIGKDPYDDSAKIVYSDDLWDKEEYDEDDVEDYYPEYDEEE
jgi:hypothetical protein